MQERNPLRGFVFLSFCLLYRGILLPDTPHKIALGDRHRFTGLPVISDIDQRGRSAYEGKTYDINKNMILIRQSILRALNKIGNRIRNEKVRFA